MNEQSNEEVTNRELFDKITTRLKDALQMSSDARLADELGLSRSNFANKKAAGTVPYEAIVSLCRTLGLRVDWVLFGEKRHPTKEEHRDALELTQVLGVILTETNTALVELGKTMSKGAPFNPSLYDLGTLGAVVYEGLRDYRFKDSTALVQEIKGQAAEVARAYWLNEIIKSADKLADQGSAQTLHSQSPENGSPLI